MSTPTQCPVAEEFLKKLHELLRDYSAEIYCTREDDDLDDVHVAIFGDDIYVGRLYEGVGK